MTVFILNTCTTVVYVIFSKNSSQSVSCETWCKGKDFYFYLPNFFEVFFSIYFFRKTSGRISDICLDSSNLILFPHRVLSPHSSCRLSHLSRLRVQKYCFITYPPNVFATFFRLFFAFPDCQGVMNTLFLLLFGITFLRSFGLTQKNQICFTPSPLGRSFRLSIVCYFLFNGNRFRSSLDLISIPV